MPTSSNLTLKPFHFHKSTFLSYKNSSAKTTTATWLLNKTHVNNTSRFSSLFYSNYSSLHSSLSFRSSFLLSYPCFYSLFKSCSPYFRSHLSSMSNSDHNPISQLPSIKTVRVMIKGRVQGVFYRDWTVENATQLGLKGWVRNRRDGSVEALFSGDPDKVQEMEQRCRHGPPSAMVTGLQIFPCNDDPGNGGKQVDQEIMVAVVRANWRIISKMLTRVFTAPQLNNVKTSACAYDDQYDAGSFSEQLPADVKEGYFVVHATNGGDPERFIIELSYLSHPGFVKLLKLAEEEFGFKQLGVLTVPCWSIEIQKILEN